MAISSNLLAIESKKTKETIKAFLKKFVSLSVLKAYIRTKLFLHFSVCSPLMFGFSNLEKTFANFSSDFLPGINFRENRPKSRNSRKFQPAKVFALKVTTLWPLLSLDTL